MNDTTDPVAELPDTSESNELDFSDSLEAAFAKLEGVADDPPPAEPEADEESEDVDSPSADKAAADDGDLLEQLNDDVGDDWTPKAANRFKQLKSELKTSRSELEQLRQAKVEYESKIKELTGIAESKDVEQLQQKLAEYEQRQMFSNLEETTAYKQAVTEPLSALMEQADQIAEKYEVDTDVLIDILALDDPEAQEEQLAELLPNASDRDKAKLFRIMEEVDPIIERRTKLFQNAEQALAEAKLLEEQRSAEEAATRARLRQNVTRNVVDRVKEKLPFLSGIESVDLDAIHKKASEADPSVLHPVDHAFNAVSAQLLPTVVREYVSLRREVESLTDRLAEYENAEPRMSGGSKTSQSSVSSDASFADRVNAALASM